MYIDYDTSYPCLSILSAFELLPGILSSYCCFRAASSSILNMDWVSVVLRSHRDEASPQTLVTVFLTIQASGSTNQIARLSFLLSK